MAPDDMFKRYQEAGADFLETARTRAEEFLQELSKMGGSTQKQASGTVDDLVEGSRKGTEQILASIRREVTAQLSQLGLATKEDLADLERRLTGSGRAAAPAPAPAPPAAGFAAAPAAPPKKAPTKAATKKAAPAKGAAEKVPAKKAPGKKAGPPKKAAGGA